jgi:hypothetical protein
MRAVARHDGDRAVHTLSCIEQYRVMDVSTPERRDRLWLINGLAVVLLKLLSGASGAVSYDRILKTNTPERREHSLFRQGCILYDPIAQMPERWLKPLLRAFTRMLDQQPLFTRTLSVAYL